MDDRLSDQVADLMEYRSAMLRHAIDLQELANGYHGQGQIRMAMRYWALSDDAAIEAHRATRKLIKFQKEFADNDNKKETAG